VSDSFHRVPVGLDHSTLTKFIDQVQKALLTNPRCRISHGREILGRISGKPSSDSRTVRYIDDVIEQESSLSGVLQHCLSSIV
jgi:hypothetical protein